jgi:signal peptidase I
MQPWWLDWTAGLFPVILVVFLLRSFLFEPFKIPSGSMIPTLLVGDLILVNKFHYGVRLPVINKKIVANNDPQRGDVMVFRYPVDPRQDYIKRVVGVPGDEVTYTNQTLTINGQKVPRRQGRVLRRGQPALQPAVHREAGRRWNTASWSTRAARPTTGPTPSRSRCRELPLHRRRRDLQGAGRATTS